MEPEKKAGKIPFLPLVAGLMVLVPVIIAAGCSGQSPGSDGPQPDGTRWILTDYMADGTLREVPGTAGITLEFGSNGQIAGSAGCNRYFTAGVMKGSAISVGAVGSTEMYCTAPGVMERESAYLELIGRAASVTAGDGRLIFADAQGTPILRYAAYVPPAPVSLAGTNWTLDSVFSGDTVSSAIAATSVTAVFGTDGEVRGSAGCNSYFGTYSVSGSSLSVGSVGSTKMNCHGSGVMAQESQFLAALGKTASYSIEGGRLTVSGADGNMLLSFTRAS